MTLLVGTDAVEMKELLLLRVCLLLDPVSDAAKAVRSLSMTVNSKTAHLVVSTNLPHEFLESLVYIPSRFR